MTSSRRNFHLAHYYYLTVGSHIRRAGWLSWCRIDGLQLAAPETNYAARQDGIAGRILPFGSAGGQWHHQTHRRKAAFDIEEAALSGPSAVRSDFGERDLDRVAYCREPSARCRCSFSSCQAGWLQQREVERTHNRPGTVQTAIAYGLRQDCRKGVCAISAR